MEADESFARHEIAPGVFAVGRYVDVPTPFNVANTEIHRVFGRSTALSKFGNDSDRLFKYVISTFAERSQFYEESYPGHDPNYWCVSAPAGTPWANPETNRDPCRDIKWRVHESTNTLDVYHFNQRSQNQYDRYPVGSKINLDESEKMDHQRAVENT